MDWPVGTNIISVYGACSGDASPPKPGQIFFYLVCFDGVRAIDITEESLRTGKTKCVDLGNAAQQLITELRLTTEKK